MKILFAVSNENIADAVKREYQNNYKAQLITKNVYYFNAIIKELQNNKTYDVVIISEDLEPFANNNYDVIDKFLVDKLQIIREEAINQAGNRLPIIFITTDRHVLGDFFTSKLYEIGIFNALVGNDRSIENVCTLMFHPRSKQEARVYYRVNAELDNTPKEDDVEEDQIKSIIAHYKTLGKAEERYVESFNNIVSQYNDAQLKVIIRFLPINVKAVLEAKSPKYQSLTTFANNYSNGNNVEPVNQPEKRKLIKEKPVSVDTNNNRVLENISSIKNTSDVVIPNAMNVDRVRKIEKNDIDVLDEEPKHMLDRRKSQESNINTMVTGENIPSQSVSSGNDVVAPTFKTNETPIDVETENSTAALPEVNSIESQQNIVSEMQEPIVKRGRGRPRKNPVPAAVPQGPKRGRGRPRKIQEPEIEKSGENINSLDNVLPGFENNNNELSTNQMNDNVLPGFENNNNELSTNQMNDNVLPGFEDNTNNNELSTNQMNDNVLPGFDDNTNNNELSTNQMNDNVLPGFEDNTNALPKNEMNTHHVSMVNNPQSFNDVSNANNILQKQEIRYENIEYLIPADKRIASFIGTSKSGVSFIVNNLAQMLSSFNINVAILDLTKNKNSYYMYTNNEEHLRNTAERSIYNLMNGSADGIKVNKNLTVYTALPTDEETFYEADKVLKTLIDNHSVILIDCDYDTPEGYFDNSTDVFMVQNMDILTMQPLTTFLKKLKSKEILKPEKLRLIVNMETRVDGVKLSELVAAVSVYKDPGMAYTVSLYDKDVIKMFTLPFDMGVYNKYLASIASCNISLSGYPKSIMKGLKELAICIYPLLSTDKKGKKNSGYAPPSLDKNVTTSFNNNMGNTLNQMKNNY